MLNPKRRNYFIRVIVLALFLLITCNCFDEPPKEDRSGDNFFGFILAYLINPPHTSCAYNTSLFSTKTKTLEPGVVEKSFNTSTIDHFYIINTPARQSVNVKIELKSNCLVVRTFYYCLNNLFGSASIYPDSRKTVCSDNTIDSGIPIQGDIGTSETCQMSYNAEAYYIRVYRAPPDEECNYEISYN